MTYLKIINISYIQALVNLPTSSLAFQRQVMMKLKVMDTLHKTDLHSKVTESAEGTLDSNSQKAAPVFSQGRGQQGLRECEHKEALARTVELVLQKQTKLQLCF